MCFLHIKTPNCLTSSICSQLGPKTIFCIKLCTYLCSKALAVHFGTVTLKIAKTK